MGSNYNFKDSFINTRETYKKFQNIQKNFKMYTCFNTEQVKLYWMRIAASVLFTITRKRWAYNEREIFNTTGVKD